MRKVAVVMLDSTQIKLSLATILDNETYVINENFCEGIKIATDLYSNGLIKPARINELLMILKSFRAIIKANQITEEYAYAVNEYLEAKNQKSFFEELYSQVGFRFVTLSKDEQLINSYISTINTLDAPKGLLVNIGGNKTQVLLYNRRNLLNQHTFDFGVCSLAEEYVKPDVSPQDYCKQMYNYVVKQVSKLDFVKDIEQEIQLVGIGEAFLSLGKLSRKLRKYPYDKSHGYSINPTQTTEVYDFVKTLDLDKTKKLKGISTDRADYLASGVAIIKAIQDVSSLDALTISETGIVDGILFNKACPTTAEKPVTDVLGHSLNTLNSYYNNYSVNTTNVYELALILFKQLKVLHKLSRT